MLKTIATLFSLLILLVIAGAGGVLWVFYEFGRDLPDYRQLADHDPPVMTRVHAGDGRLLAEYATEKRVFVPIQVMPRTVKQALLSAEDKNFYNHPGLDFRGITRAILTNLKNIGSGRRLVGASTITQQVAKNFLLTSEVSWERKVKEAILAFRIERAFSKDRILELYLNEIYLGLGSYGVAAAALNYFDKSLDELTTAEAAYLAALPKAPNNYHPVKKFAAAKARRDWVIGRMVDDGHLSPAEARLAWAEPLALRKRQATQFVRADVFAEEVRRELMERFGENTLYKGGLSVRTTLDPKLQEIAVKTLREGLIAYDRRHGWRGPVAVLKPVGNWLAGLHEVAPPKGAPETWQVAAVTAVDAKGADIVLQGGGRGWIPLPQLRWARAWKEDQKRGPRIKAATEVLKPGEVVLVETVAGQAVDEKAAEGAKDGKTVETWPEGAFGLRQIPDIDGALVALDPHTGRVLAMAGGWAYERSQFNRAVQAERQPGSAFKPFVYLSALEAGYTPATLILDAPFVVDQGPGLPKWRPANYTKKFYGPSTMRLGVEKSRNLMTVRLAQAVGMEKVAEVARRFGVVDYMAPTLAMSLGAAETTLLKLTAGYAMFVNGGKSITPSVIDRIQDKQGRTVFRHDTRPCPGCLPGTWRHQTVPEIPDVREQVADPANAYQVVSMLQGVVQRGTGRRVRAVGKPLAGKTGTTNESQDTWFIGFAPDLAAGIFVGFDEPRTLGRRETGSSVPAPIFRDFMKAALSGKPATPFRVPRGIRLVRVKASNGRPALPADRNVILEAFLPGTVPTGKEEVLEGRSWTAGYNRGSGEGAAPSTGTGGLY